VTEELDCAATRDLIPELAAGVAAGDERAAALAHVADCADCQRSLAATAEIVDQLLLLAPEREPPPGFESAVLSAILGPSVPSTPHRRPRWRGPLLWAASVAAVAGLVAGLLWWRTADDRRLAADFRHTLAVAHGTDLRAAELTLPDGADSGAVFAYQGSPSWIYVTFRRPPTPGDYEVRLRTEDGHQRLLRTFTAREGARAWGSTIELPIREISDLEFLRSGVPVMTARFSP
jgi:hypothetical protein